MPSIVWIALALLAVGLGVLVYVAIAATDPVRRRIASNLGGPVSVQVATAPSRLSAPTPQRVLKVPRGEMALLDRLLSEAGRPAAWPLERVVSVKLLSTVLVGALMALLVLSHPTRGFIVIGVVVTLLVYALPELRLWSIGMERRTAMGHELADMLDQMSIAVEAGLGFEGALVRVSSEGKGVLAQEFRRTVQDMQMGQSRRDAYLDLATRAKVPELRRFVRTIIQAEQTGLPMAEVLKSQAAEMRLIRRQTAEEKAQRIPVLVTFPLAFTILPVLFIVILGPAAMRIASTLSGGGL